MIAGKFAELRKFAREQIAARASGKQVTIIVTVVLFAIWIIALDTYAGVRDISPSLDEMGHSFGASRWQLLTTVLSLHS